MLSCIASSFTRPATLYLHYITRQPIGIRNIAMLKHRTNKALTPEQREAHRVRNREYRRKKKQQKTSGYYPGVCISSTDGATHVDEDRSDPEKEEDRAARTMPVLALSSSNSYIQEASPEIASHVVIPQHVTPARLQPYAGTHSSARKRVISKSHGNGDSMGLLGSGTGARTKVQSVVDRGKKSKKERRAARRCGACVRACVG
jgi:hypothetical protein